MPVAIDRAPRYFGTPLSENIAERPEGYLICRNVPIARTGFQKYKVAEIADPDGLLGDRGPHEEVELWRDPEEVFSPATIASFEGVSVTLRHPEDLLTPDSEQRHAVGHVENVRKGDEALESGDWPLVGDLIVKAADAIRAVKAGIREVSCGYKYRLAKEGYRFDQREIRGNHVAIVPKGRAGEEARIQDAAPGEETGNMNILKSLFGKGFSIAKDAKAEDIAAVSRVIALDEQPGDRVDHTEIVGPKTLVGKKLVKVGTDEKGNDLYRAIGMDDDMEAENKAAMDRRKRLHDALDRQLDGAEKEAKEREEQNDADVEELKKILAGEKEEEAGDDDMDDAHPEGCRCDDCKSAHDDAIVSPEPVLTSEERPKSAFDAATHTLNVLKGLRPFVAKANDASLSRAFGLAYDSVKAKTTDTSKQQNGGSYGRVREAAGKLNDEARNQAKDHEQGAERLTPAQDSASKFEKTMAEEMKARREAVRRKR